MQPFTDKQEACIIGGLLGDLHIQQTLSTSKNCRLRFSHSLKQKEYLDWKYKLFETDFCERTKAPYLVEKKKQNKKDEFLVEPDLTYKNYVFYTEYREEFQRFHSNWYTLISHSQSVLVNQAPLLSSKKRFRKTVALDIAQILTNPLALAVWYLDDGTKRADTESCRFASHAFSKEEHVLLADCMSTNFGITPRIESWAKNKAGETAYSLALLSRTGDYKKFRDLVYPIVQAEIPSMLYKL